MNNDVKVFDWDDEIEKESEFVLLDDGDYDFTIKGFERARFEGSEKIPACPMAIVSFEVKSSVGSVTLTDRFYLSSVTEWKLSQLFKSVGLKKTGEKCKMDWKALPGTTGRCKVVKKKNVKNDNFHNEIATLYAKSEGSDSVW